MRGELLAALSAQNAFSTSFQAAAMPPTARPKASAASPFMCYPDENAEPGPGGGVPMKCDAMTELKELANPSAWASSMPLPPDTLALLGSAAVTPVLRCAQGRLQDVRREQHRRRSLDAACTSTSTRRSSTDLRGRNRHEQARFL
eukprot:TRINITY_DN5683_c0_g1_i1.p1 TRINITY_DN5683_c0_g1~~TRINITY_DN5683_c0_g1_i1.p1  ORF type:complete len:166 (+),score=20.54 TRINITY_DN5683_c0_g1_i1:66-500(+)